jgi:hypothetical protein
MKWFRKYLDFACNDYYATFAGGAKFAADQTCPVSSTRQLCPPHMLISVSQRKMQLILKFFRRARGALHIN